MQTHLTTTSSNHAFLFNLLSMKYLCFGSHFLQGYLFLLSNGKDPSSAGQ